MINKRKQKAPIGFIIISILFGAIWGVLSNVFSERMLEQSNIVDSFTVYYVFFFISLFLSYFIQIIIHEAGHLIFGMLSGYKPVSFRIGSFHWQKFDGKIRLKRLSLSGTGGQCLMAPPEFKDGKLPFVLYNLGGVLLNLIVSILFLGFAYLLYDNAVASFLLINFALPGILIALLNGIPMNAGGVNNDGKNIIAMKKSTKAVRAMWIQLKINQLNAQGVELKNMPAEWFALPDPEDMKNGLIAVLGYMATERKINELNFEEACDLARLYVSSDNAMPMLNLNLVAGELIYLELVTRKGEVNVDLLYDKNLQAFMKAMKKYPAVMRVQYTYALLREGDYAKAEKIRKEFIKTTAKYPYPVKLENERELMDIATAKYNAQFA